MGVCASAESGGLAPFTLSFVHGAAPQTLGNPNASGGVSAAVDVAFVAVSRWRQKHLAAAFHTWWELWAARQGAGAAVSGGRLYTYAQRRRLRRAFHTWAREQLSQKRAWRAFQDGDANLPPPPHAVEDGEGQRGGGWRAVRGAHGPPPPTPRWMESWDDAKARIAAIKQQNKVAATRRRRLERATNQRAWAQAEAALARADRARDATGASSALQWVQSLLPQGRDALAGEWRAVGQYTDASNCTVRVSESFMVIDGPGGQRYGYPLPPAPASAGGYRDSTDGWFGRITGSGIEGAAFNHSREYVLQNFQLLEGGERVEWTQLFRDGNATHWSCVLAPDPQAPGGFCMAEGQWRDLTLDSAEAGAYIGSFTATAGPRGRPVLHVEEHWGEVPDTQSPYPGHFLIQLISRCRASGRG